MIDIDEANMVFGICEDFIVNLERNSLIRYIGISDEVLVGKDYKGIDSFCFESNPNISSVTFESGSRLSVLDEGAFQFCTRLESIHIVRTVESICDFCFFQCWGMRTVTFESGSRVSVIGEMAFFDCRSLQSICIPSSVTTIAGECFLACRSLAIVELETGSRVSVVAGGAFVCCSSSLRLPDRVTDCMGSQVSGFH
jgi:hypothetical protein